MFVNCMILFFICAFLSVCEEVMLHKKKRDSKTISTLVWINYFLSFLSIYFVREQMIQIFSLQDTLWTNVLIVFIISLLYMILIFKLPKRFANKNIKHLDFLEPFIHTIRLTFSWLSWTFSFDTEFEEEAVSEEDIRELISTGSEIEEPQKEMIENIFELDDTSVEELCTHRSQVITLDLEQDIEEWQEIIHDNRHTFYPICGNDDDDIIGVLDTRDYFRIDGPLSQEMILEHAVDKPFFVSENTKADTCFHEMKNRRTYFAIVLDEYGGMTGIITLHDIIETLLGEMNEIDDEIEPDDIQKLDDNQWYIRGSADLEEVQETLHIPLPIDEYDTFSGYVLASLGRIPDDGTTFELELKTMTIHVKEIKNHCVGQAIVFLKKEERENG